MQQLTKISDPEATLTLTSLTLTLMVTLTSNVTVMLQAV